MVGPKTEQNMAMDLILLLTCKTGLLQISLYILVNILKHHYQMLMGHEWLGQAHKYLSFDISKSCLDQILNKILYGY